MLKYFFFFFLLTTISCNNELIDLNDIGSRNIFPVGIAENINLVYTDSAEVKAILRSPLNKDFTNLKFPYSEFPNGVEITFYDTEKNETLVSSIMLLFIIKLISLIWLEMSKLNSVMVLF